MTAFAFTINIDPGTTALLNVLVTGVVAYFLAKLSGDQKARAVGDAERANAAELREKAAAVRADEQTKKADEVAKRAEEVRLALQASEKRVAEFQAQQTAQLAEVALKAEEVRKTAAEAAVKVGEVKESLATSMTNNTIQLDGQDRKLDALAIVANSSHILINQKWGDVLKLRMEDRKEIARLDDTPENTELFRVAKELYDEHQLKQAAVDAQPGTDEQKTGGAGLSRLGEGVAPVQVTIVQTEPVKVVDVGDKEEPPPPKGGFHHPLLPSGAEPEDVR